MDNNIPQTETTPKIKKTQKVLKILLPVFILVAIVTMFILFFSVKPETIEDSENTSDFYYEELTEEEKRETEMVMDEYAEVIVGGYKEVEDELGFHDAITINVKNISDKEVSLAISVVAKDQEGNILDKSSLYAEGIEPGQTQVFQTFVYSTLTREELKTAQYEVFKARTYEIPAPETDANL